MEVIGLEVETKEGREWTCGFYSVSTFNVCFFNYDFSFNNKHITFVT